MSDHPTPARGHGVGEVYLVDAVRTPFGRAGHKGVYANTRADDLVAKAIVGLLERNKQIPAGRIDDVAIAATKQQGDQGLTLGRTAAILAGLPVTVPGLAIDRMCSGAMTSAALMAGSIGLGMYDVALAGGVKHMGHHPVSFDDVNPRFRGESLMEDDAFNMGVTAENVHDRFPRLTRERADRYGMRSQQKAEAAYEAGKIQLDLVPVAITGPDGAAGLATEDQGRRPETTMEGLAGLKTPFRPHGRVTAGTSSPLTDGATIGLLAGADAVTSSAWHPNAAGLVRLRRRAARDHGHRPDPVHRESLRKAGLTIDDIGLFELNEAFAIQVLALLDHFGIDDDDPRVNPWGGAIALAIPGRVRRSPHDSARRTLRRAARRPVRPDSHVRRPRPGRLDDLGEPALRRLDRERRA